MKIVKIPVNKIKDWETFHKIFTEILGFPDFYGKNMDAWIDCMTYIDEPDDGMTSIYVDKGQMMVLNLGDCTVFASKYPTQYKALIDCSAFVNYRRIEAGGNPVLALSFWNNKVNA